MNGIRMDRWLLSLFYILAFILLREWLIPVMELTNTGGLKLFLSFILVAFILYFISTKWWIAVPVKLLYIFGVVHAIYLEAFFPSLSTIGALLQDLISNFAVIVNGDWDNITNPFRTVLFFVLLWMTTYLIRHWIETKRSIFLFYMLTVLFIAFIDTFSAYSADGAIFRIMATGFLLLGLLFISNLGDRHRVEIPSSAFVATAVPLFFIVIISGFFVALLPKQDPVWPDPVPFLQAVVEGTDGHKGEKGIAKSGYGPDDSVLGGPFIEDDTLVFEATVDRKQYWKVETKNTYTSKGWEQILDEENVTLYIPGQKMETFELNENIEVGQTKLAQINMFEKFPFLVYPYGLTRVDINRDVSIHYWNDNGQYLTKFRENETTIDSYEIDYALHDFSLKALRSTQMESLDTLGNDFAEYLQLPEALPARVGELAEGITASSDSVYEKTKAIERYFGNGDFRYDREEVAIPGEEDDYVDQFLFDTKIGYCDNFSTSMVVMLRTVGIPARWVKGFAPGEVAKNAKGESVYQITNNEAHSWVEAYMPGVGWMPFEPTIGFGTPARIDYDMELKENDPEIKEMPEKDQLEQKKSKDATKVKSDFDFNKLFSSIGVWLRGNLWWIFIGVAGLLIGGWGLYRLRRKWLPKVLITKYRADDKDWDAFVKRYMSLLKQLERAGVAREAGETLATYAVRVDAHFGKDMMVELTTVYEKGIYGEDRTSHDWQGLQVMWEDLIKRTSN